MRKIMKIFLLVVLVIASIWDAFTTIYGTIQVLGDNAIQIGAAILFSALVFSFVLNTKRIFKWQRGFANILVKLLWLIAFSYDIFTSWLGNANLLVGGSSTSREIIILIGLTVLVSAAPILLSGMGYKTETSPSTHREVTAS